MDVTHAVAFAKELEGELIAEVARAREERLLLKTLNGARLEERLSQKRAFEERGAELQRKLRTAIRATALGAGLRDSARSQTTSQATNPAGMNPGAGSEAGGFVGKDLLAQIGKASPEGEELASRVASIGKLAQELGRLNRLNHHLAERALACTRAYVRALAPRPSAYDRRGVESPVSALSSISRRA